MSDEERAQAVSAEEPKDVARLREAFASIEGDGASDPVDAERIFDALHGDDESRRAARHRRAAREQSGRCQSVAVGARDGAGHCTRRRAGPCSGGTPAIRAVEMVVRRRGGSAGESASDGS